MNRHTGAYIQHKHASITILIFFEKILNKVWNKKCQFPHHYMLPFNLKTGEELPIASCACVTLLWVFKSPSVFTNYNPQRMVRGTECKRLWSPENTLSPAELHTSRHVCEHVCQCLHTCEDLCLWVGWGGETSVWDVHFSQGSLPHTCILSTGSANELALWMR